MSNKHKSTDYKHAAVKHYLNVSHNLLETSRVMGCNNKTLGKWVARYQETGRIDRLNRDAVSCKITENQVNYAVNYLCEHQTMAELHAIMLERYPDFNITPQHLGQVIRNNNLTHKRTKHRH